MEESTHLAISLRSLAEGLVGVDGRGGGYPLPEIGMALCGLEAPCEIVDRTMLEQGFHEGEEDPGGCLWVCPITIIHTLVIDDHVAIPLARSHDLIPLAFSVVGSYPLTQGRQIMWAAIGFLGALEDEGRNGMNVDAVLDMAGEECRWRSGINQDGAGGRGETGNKNGRLDATRMGRGGG